VIESMSGEIVRSGDTHGTLEDLFARDTEISDGTSAHARD
jgi:hypothetical protein